jgi:hypothetical protein
MTTYAITKTRSLRAALSCLSSLGEHAVHRADGREVDATAEQRRVRLRWRLVGELGRMERVQDACRLQAANVMRKKMICGSESRTSEHNQWLEASLS